MTAVLSTRLTEQLGIVHPIVSVPIALAGGGALAAAVARAGGLGLIGGGYGNSDWIRTQFEAAGFERVGVGFITWSVQRSPDVVTEALALNPIAVMLSFGDPAAFADQIKDVGDCTPDISCRKMRGPNSPSASSRGRHSD